MDEVYGISNNEKSKLASSQNFLKQSSSIALRRHSNALNGNVQSGNGGSGDQAYNSINHRSPKPGDNKKRSAHNLTNNSGAPGQGTISTINASNAKTRGVATNRDRALSSAPTTGQVSNFSKDSAQSNQINLFNQGSGKEKIVMKRQGTFAINA